MAHPCPRCGSSTIAWEIFEPGVEMSEGRKCFFCGKFTEEEKKKESPKIAGEEKVNMVDQNKTGGEKPRLCKDCGEKPTISAKCPYCASCMRKRSIVARERKKEESGRDQTGLIKTPPGPKEAPKSEMAVVQVDFGGYPQILEGLKKMAKEEIRPVELQILYLVKSYLGRVNDPLRAA